ncbi:MAG TPA: CBS domain-containing protein [Devosia sp.]|nr:CBS domain-containing protein [Devosia sp.]
MKVSDVMTRNLVTVMPGHSIRHAARIMLEHRISGLPVVDAGELVGMLTEGDLLRRVEFGAPRPRTTGWSGANSPEGVARDFVKSHSWKVGDVMSRSPATTSEEASLADVASIMAARAIKRLPVMRDGRLVGLVSRADLLQAIATAPDEHIASGDESLATSIRARLGQLETMLAEIPTVLVTNGVANLWGSVRSEVERDAIRVVVESVPGLKGIDDHMSLFLAAARETSEAPSMR